MYSLILIVNADINLMVGRVHVCLTRCKAGTTLAHGPLTLLRAVRACYDAKYDTMIVDEKGQLVL